MAGRAALFNIKQTLQQSTEAFVNEICSQCYRAQAFAQEMRYAALAGLQDSVKAHVLHHEVRSLDDIIRWGDIGDSLVTPSGTLFRGIADLNHLPERLQVSQSTTSLVSHLFAAVNQPSQEGRGFVQNTSAANGQFIQQMPVNRSYTRGVRRGKRSSQGRYGIERYE